MSSRRSCRDKKQVKLSSICCQIYWFFAIGNKKHALKHTKVRVNALKEELRNLRLQRAKHSSSLSHDLTKIAIQQLEKKKLGQMKNQQLGKSSVPLVLFITSITTANEVSMLNHQTTILTDQLLSLRQGTHALSEGLSRIKSGVISKQQQLEEEQRQKEVSMREDISKTRKSLEVIAIVDSDVVHLPKFYL